MSKVIKDQPEDIETLKSLIKASRKEGKPVILTDSKCKTSNYACGRKPEVAVLDLSTFGGSGEVRKVETLEGSSKPSRGSNVVHPADQSHTAQEPQSQPRCRIIEDDEHEGSSCSCIGKASGKRRKMLQKLRKRVGKSVKIDIQEFTNWGETYEKIVFAAYPKTKDHITKLIRAAKENKLRVRCVGAGHSWANIFVDAGQMLLHLDKLKTDYPKGANIRLADGEGLVDVMSGTTTGELKQFQLDNDLCLPSNVLIDVLKINGVVSTGSHGTGFDAFTPGDYLVRMRIFDSDGNLRVYTIDDPEMMKAVSASFGAFGIIYDMTFGLQPKRIVLTKHEYVPARSLLNDARLFKNYIESNWSAQLFWIPFNSRSPFDDYDPMEDEILLRLVNDDTSGEPEEDGDYYEDKDRMDYITSTGMDASSFLYTHFPLLTPIFCDAAFSLLQAVYPDDKERCQALPHAVHYRKYMNMQRLQDLEFVFDLRDDYEKLIKVIKLVINLTVKYSKAGKYPLNITLEMRWMAYSKSFLCPANLGNPDNGGSGHVFYIEIVSFHDTDHWKEFSIEVAQQWMAYGGLPHLAKEWEYVPNILGHIKKKMGKSISQFRKQLKKSKADPNGMFMNNTLCQLIS